MRIRDPFIQKDSVIHGLPAAIKLTAAVILIVIAVLLPRTFWVGYAALGITLLAVAIFSRLPYIRILKRLLLLESFILMVSILSLFQPQGTTIFISLIVKGSLCIFVMILLIASTRFSEIIQVLWNAHIPPILVTTISLMYRYLFLITSEADRLSRARASRTFIAGRWLTWHTFANVIGHLFVRTSERAERIYAAMCARGWKA